MTWIESPLFPNLLYLALMAGLWFAALAIVSPGTGVLELLALIALAAAGLGTIVLPLNVWAVALLLEQGLMAVHPLLALVVSALTLGYFWFAIRKAVVAQQASPSIDPARVLNQIAEVRTELNPIGSIYALGELWTARADKPIKPGTKVRVTGREGLVLIVEPLK
jgi:membrane-bound serine protease (ClpP class)